MRPTIPQQRLPINGDSQPIVKSNRAKLGVSRTGRLWTAAVIPFAVSAALAALCFASAGVSLGLYFGGIAVASMVVPALALAEAPGWRRAIAMGAVVDAVGLIWIGGALAGRVSIMQWLACYVLLGAYVAAVWGIAEFLGAIRIPAVVAAMLTSVLALAWLSWPVWMSPWLAGQRGTRVAAWLVSAHPLFALNGVLRSVLGIWTERSVIYRLSNLNQDIAYTLPGGIGMSAAACVAIAVVSLVLASGLRRARGARELISHANAES
jgi:hypothetical protein